MTELGHFIDPATVRFERLLPAPQEDVWNHLTDAELLSAWLGDGRIAPEIGGVVELRAGGAVIRGRILAYEKPKLLSYTWSVFMPGAPAPTGGESVLRFELAPRGEETTLVLTHGPLDADYRSRTAAGWHALLGTLRAHLAGEEAGDFVATFNRVHPEYEKLLS